MKFSAYFVLIRMLCRLKLFYDLTEIYGLPTEKRILIGPFLQHSRRDAKSHKSVWLLWLAPHVIWRSASVVSSFWCCWMLKNNWITEKDFWCLSTFCSICTTKACCALSSGEENSCCTSAERETSHKRDFKTTIDRIYLRYSHIFPSQLFLQSKRKLLFDPFDPTRLPGILNEKLFEFD